MDQCKVAALTHALAISRDNVVMQNLLKKLGFTRCGTIYVEEDDYPRIFGKDCELYLKQALFSEYAYCKNNGGIKHD